MVTSNTVGYSYHFLMALPALSLKTGESQFHHHHQALSRRRRPCGHYSWPFYYKIVAAMLSFHLATATLYRTTENTRDTTACVSQPTCIRHSCLI